MAFSSGLDKVLEILGSKGGQTVVGAVGAGLEALGAAKERQAAREEAQANRAQTARQFQANMAQRQLENQQADQLRRATAALEASPLGANEAFAQRQAILGELLRGARNFSVTPSDAEVAAAMPSVAGGIRLPEGGFSPEMIDRLFGDKATLQALQQRAAQVGQINPAGSVPDFSAMFGPAGAASTQSLLDVNQALLEKQMADEARQRDIIMRAIDEDIKGEMRGPAPPGFEYDKKTGQLKKKGGGIGGFFKGLGKIAGIAAPFIGGPAGIAGAILGAIK